MDYDLESLTRSNAPPTELQAHQLQLVLDDALIELSHLDKTIGETILSLPKLAEERHRRARLVQSVKEALSPIRRLPTEILAEIFLWCRANNLRAGNYCVADPSTAPMLLAQISSRWRNICHGTPQLWDLIYLTTSGVSPALTADLLARSRNLPISVELREDNHISPTPPTATHTIAIPWDYCDRLKRFSITSTVSFLPPDILRQRLMFPILTSLQIKVDGTPQLATDAVSFLMAFTNAPRLHRLRLTANCAPALPLNFACPWSQLTHLALSLPIELAETRDILVQCTALQQCTLLELIHNRSIAPPMDTAELAYLTKFEIYIEDGEPSPDNFFEAFSFPGLLDLSIGGDAWLPRILLDLYGRSHFRLERLELQVLDMASSDLVLFLRCIPTLQTLELSYSCVDDELFRSFTCSPDSSSPSFTLPLLTCIDITNESDMVDGELVAAMAESSCEYGGNQNGAFPALKSVKLDLDGPRFSREVEDRLAAACATRIVTYRQAKFRKSHHSMNFTRVFLPFSGETVIMFK
ncbi:hypothetical protein B0H11DRAFT_1954495 [Mycena galericulata]|nr:hypothetical protein B0H11DRAFT_1954495 [Mycena galericulata]